MMQERLSQSELGFVWKESRKDGEAPLESTARAVASWNEFVQHAGGEEQQGYGTGNFTMEEMRLTNRLEDLEDVPRDKCIKVIASLLCFDAAYGAVRNAEWPYERCYDLVKSELGEDIQAFFPGEYWAVYPSNLDDEEHSGSGCSGMFPEAPVTCTFTCFALTADSCFIFSVGDED